MRWLLGLLSAWLCLSCVTPTPAEDPVAHDDDARSAEHDDLEKLLSLSRGTPDEPAILGRLASLEEQQARLAQRQAQERAVLAAEASQRGSAPVHDAQQAEAKRLELEAESLRRSAITRLDAFANRWPASKETPKALLLLAELQREQHDDAAADAALDTLVRNYGTTPLAADAHLARAERLFEKAELEAAIAEYDLAAKADRFLAYATYKRAWCELNLSRFQPALDDFARAMGMGDSKIANEAAKDWVRAWAMAPGSTAQGAKDALTPKTTPAGLKKLLARLAAAYRELGRPDESAAADALAR